MDSIASDNDFYYEPNPWLSDSISTVPSASPIPLSPQGSIHSDNNNSFIFHHDYDYGCVTLIHGKILCLPSVHALQVQGHICRQPITFPPVTHIQAHFVTQP